MSNFVEYIISIKEKSDASIKKINASLVSANANAKKIQENFGKLPTAITGAVRTIDFLNTKLTVLKEKKAFATTYNEVRELNGEIKKTERELHKLENLPPKGFIARLKEIPKTFLGLSLKDLGYAFFAQQMFSFLKGSTTLYDQAAKKQAQLQASLESTGYTAGRTFSQLTKAASELQGKTIFDDDDISGAQSILLTFTKVRGVIFDKAIPAIADLSTKMGTDLNSATLQVGKALNQPIEGITALRRAGIQFTDDQEASIENLVQSGKLEEAQLIILSELQKQFGGSAEAAAKAGMGPLQQLSVMWDNLREKLGGFILNVVNKFVPVLKDMATWLDRNSNTIKIIAKIVLTAVIAFTAFKIAAGGASLAMQMAAVNGTFFTLVAALLKTGVTGLIVAFRALNTAMKANIFGLLISVAVTAITAFQLFKKRTDALKESIEAAKQTSMDYYAKEKSGLDVMFEKLRRTNPKSKERNDLVNQLKEMYPELNKQILDEIRNTNNLAGAYDFLVEKIKLKAKTKYKESVLETVYGEQGRIEDVIKEQLSEKYNILQSTYTNDPGYTIGNGNVKIKNELKPLEEFLQDELNDIINNPDPYIKYPAYVKSEDIKSLIEINKKAEAVVKEVANLQFGSAQNGSGGGGGGGTVTPQYASDAIAGGGKSMKQIIINLNSGLIETNNNYFDKTQDPKDANDFMSKLTKALASVVNDVNYSA